MEVVIRLQGLRSTAGSKEIRKFFTGLEIPDGGVHIIGGEKEEAFIIFASSQDARRAMTRSGGYICGSPVNLLLSSKTEMQCILERSTKNEELNQRWSLERSSRSMRSGSRSDRYRRYSPPRSRGAVSNSDDLYLFLKGMPFSVTKNDVREFFNGLVVDDIILFKNDDGRNNGLGLVKFGTGQNARDGQQRDGEYIGSRFVQVYPATEDRWLRAWNKFGRSESPNRPQRNPQLRPRSRSPLVHRSNSPSSEEFCVLLENLSRGVEKTNIKEFFRHARLEDDQILYLPDRAGKRTSSAFVLFKSLSDYCAAITRHKDQFCNSIVNICPVSRERMISILESSHMEGGSSARSDTFQEGLPYQQDDPYDSEKVCLYVRNMPFDVRKVEIMDFFHGFNITEDKVALLCDPNGVGLGEGLVIFRSELEAMRAQSLNGQRFLGSEVMLKCITRSEMKEFGIKPPAVQRPMKKKQRYSSWTSEVSSHPDYMDYADKGTPPKTYSPTSNLHVHNDDKGSNYDSYTVDPYVPSKDGGYGSPRGLANTAQRFEGPGKPAQPEDYDGPTCVKLLNLPFQIKIDEIYDFCYGYRVIPGSASLQYDKNGKPRGSATVVFESRQEALTAQQELSGRPIGARKIQVVFV